MKKAFLIRAEEQELERWRRASKVAKARSLNAWIIAVLNAATKKGGQQ